MKKILFILLMILTVVLAACGGKKEYTIILGGNTEVKVGESVNWTAKIDDLDGSFDWKSSDENIATVAAGKITGISEGEATITVSLKEDSSVNASKKIKVVADEVIVYEITISKNEVTLYPNESDYIEATVTPDTMLVWSSSDNDVANVDNGLINAFKAGKTIITVETIDGSCKKEINVTVKEEEVGYSARDLQKDLVSLKNEYITSKSVNLLLETNNNGKTSNIELIYNLDDNNLFEDLKYEVKGNITSSLYIKDHVSYMMQETAKIKYSLSTKEEELLVNENSSERFLSSVTSFYNEEAFYVAIEKAKEEDNYVEFELVLNDYLGSCLNVDGVDKVTLKVTFENNSIISVELVYNIKDVTTSAKVNYRGTSKQNVEYPNDLDTYVE